MASTKRSDGNSVDVVLAGAAVHGQPVYAQGWHGIAQTDGATGDTIALDLVGEYELNVGALAAAKGAILYLTTGGALSVTNTDRPFAKVTVAKDSNNICWAKLLPQTA